MQSFPLSLDSLHVFGYLFLQHRVLDFEILDFEHFYLDFPLENFLILRFDVIVVDVDELRAGKSVLVFFDLLGSPLVPVP